jgi:hypothetical protein
MEGQVSVFSSISPTDRMAQLYSQAPLSLFVTFNDSQAYGGCTLTRLHTGKFSLLSEERKALNYKL